MPHQHESNAADAEMASASAEQGKAAKVLSQGQTDDSSQGFSNHLEQRPATTLLRQQQPAYIWAEEKVRLAVQRCVCTFHKRMEPSSPAVAM